MINMCCFSYNGNKNHNKIDESMLKTIGRTIELKIDKNINIIDLLQILFNAIIDLELKINKLNKILMRIKNTQTANDIDVAIKDQRYKQRKKELDVVITDYQKLIEIQNKLNEKYSLVNIDTKTNK